MTTTPHSYSTSTAAPATTPARAGRLPQARRKAANASAAAGTCSKLIALSGATSVPSANVTSATPP